MSESPFTFAEARNAALRASEKQVEAERQRKRDAEDLAAKELAYRRLKAQKIVELHASGCAWTAADALAEGDNKVAQARYSRDVARGVADCNDQAAYRLGADRRVLETLVQWSMRRELAEGGAS